MARLWHEAAGKWLRRVGAPESWKSDAGSGLPPHPGRRSPAEDDVEDDCHVFATEQLGLLASAIESEIIPRLMMAYRADMEALNPASGGSEALVQAPLPPREPQPQVRQEDVLALAQLVLEEPASAARLHCEDMRARGVPLVQMLLHLLAPTARHLGELWEADEVDFTSVTIALCSLQQLMRELTRSADPDHQEDAGSGIRRVLLAPFPGEQHTFGVLMVGEFFQRAGWEVGGHGALTGQELLRLAGAEWFAMIGVSVAQDTALEDVTALIEQIRRVSKNTKVSVLVGGRLFADDPELIHVVGADATARDAEGALAVAEELLEKVV